MNKQIEEKDRSICESCLHYYECWQADEDTVACSRYLDDKEWRKASDVAREIFAEIDNALHAMATEYHKAGHPEYYAVCEMVYHKVMRPIQKKYESEGADDESVDG